MEVKAQLNGLRMAPRKVRLVVGLIKKKDVDAAIGQLSSLSNRASLPVRKLINSAIANAENNFKMVRSNLYIKSAWVDEGVKLRRWHPKGFGRAGAIQKKISHINVILDERVSGMRAAATVKSSEKKSNTASSVKNISNTTKENKNEKNLPVSENASDNASSKNQRGDNKHSTGSSKPAVRGLKGFGKKLFRRKSI